MKRTTITWTDDLAELPRAIPWAGIFSVPGMVPGERIEEALAEGWADAIDRDRG